MSLPITRDEAWELVNKYNSDDKDLVHYLESEAILRELAVKLGEDEDYYGMLGLLHDIDWGMTKDNVETHLTKAPGILRDAGFDEDFIDTVVSHGYGFDVAGLLDKKRSKKIEYALAAGETLSGLIHATALMRPEKLEGMKAKSVRKKFKDKTFAKGVHRGIIEECKELGIELDEFFEIGIEALKKIKTDVGLG